MFSSAIGIGDTDIKEYFKTDKPAPKDFLSFDILAGIAPDTPSSKLNELVAPLNQALIKYSIDTPLRIRHFLAQIACESDGFNTMREYASGEDYEGRPDLGNDQEGDGVRFAGRGLIEITGRANYERCGKALGIDLIKEPELLQEPTLACLSAGWFWHSHELNAIADQDDCRRITRIINGGYNGLDDRLLYLDRAKNLL